MTTPAEQASQGGDQAESTTPERLDRLEGAVDRIEQLLKGGAATAHQASQDKVEQRLDRPASIEEQIEAGLEKRDKARKAADDRKAAADADKAWRERTDEKIAALAEQPPAPPVPRRQKMLGWGP